MKATGIYGLPQDFDGSFLVGKELEMVCFCQVQLYLHFAGKIIITVSSAISRDDGQIIDVPIEYSNLMRMIGLLVASAEGPTDGTLTIHFENGEVLKVYDNSPNFESYSITYGDAVLYV